MHNEPDNEKQGSGVQPPDGSTALTVDEREALALDLLGVIADVEDGDGFDAVCLQTIKRVHGSLVGTRPVDMSTTFAEPSSHTAVPDEPKDLRVREALARLVAIEDLKKSHAQAAHHAARFPTDENYSVVDALMTDIAKLRKGAWEAARSALAEGMK